MKKSKIIKTISKIVTHIETLEGQIAEAEYANEVVADHLIDAKRALIRAYNWAHHI